MTGKYTNEPAHPEMTGAEIVLQALRDNGVEHIFGYPGAAVLPIYDEIFQQQDIRHILVRHEQGAGHAAEGYARSTGKTGVMLVTSGPGVTNTITSLQNAMIDSVPIVCLSGQVATTLIGSDAFQECDTLGITGPCTKHSWLVTDVSKLAETIHKAFRIAHSGRPGPVLVDMPKDILVQSTFYTGPSAIEKSSSGQQWEAFYRASPDTRTDEMVDTIAALQYALDRLYELTRNHSPFVTTDLARHRLWSSQFDNAGQRTTSSGFGTIGYGLPAAIGMQIAHPESLVIDIADQSSVQATMKELSTAVQYKAPVKVFILNNESAEPLRQQRQTSHSYSKALPDFVKMAEAFGAVGMRCDKVDELDSAIEEMIAVKGPVLFDCHIADCSPTKADNPI